MPNSMLLVLKVRSVFLAPPSFVSEGYISVNSFVGHRCRQTDTCRHRHRHKDKRP